MLKPWADLVPQQTALTQSIPAGGNTSALKGFAALTKPK